MTALRLEWNRTRADMFVARCGSRAQGRVCVWRDPTGGWSWRLDMLPDDQEPLVYSERSYASMPLAMRAAEAQAEAWPVLIENATRGQDW